jgi:chaperonin cofactor prefoldin
LGGYDDLGRPPLRYRRLGGGYRRDDVDLLLAELRLTLRAFELELGTLRDRGRELEGRLREARSEIDAYHAKGYELARVMNSVRERSATIERAAEERAAELVARAEAEARQRVETAEARIAELRGEEARLVSGVRALVERIGGTVADSPAPGPAPEEQELEPVENGFPGVGALPGRPAPRATSIELDVGPFADFDAVADFERALAELPGVEDVYVRRVRAERASIELTLVGGVPLLARMRELLPYRLSVRDRSLDRLVVDVEAPAPAGSG